MDDTKPHGLSQFILLAIWSLQPVADTASISRRLQQATKNPQNYHNVYHTLKRLEAKGLIRVSKSDKPKFGSNVYNLTSAGREQLVDFIETFDKLMSYT